MSYCTQCGKKLLEQDKFCASCGQKVEQIPEVVSKPKSFEERFDEILKIEIPERVNEQQNFEKKPKLNYANLDECKDRVATNYAMKIMGAILVVVIGGVLIDVLTKSNLLLTGLGALLYLIGIFGYPFYVLNKMIKDTLGKYRISKAKDDKESSLILLSWWWSTTWRSLVLGLIIVYPLIDWITIQYYSNPFLMLALIFLCIGINAYVTMRWIFAFQFGSSKLVVLNLDKK